MNIPLWTWIVGGLSAIGIVWTGVKNIREIASFLSSLNGWSVLAFLCVAGLIVFAVSSYMQWLNSRFEALSSGFASSQKLLGEEMQKGFTNETGSRAGVHAYVNTEFEKLQTRLSKIEAWFKSKNVPL